MGVVLAPGSGASAAVNHCKLPKKATVVGRTVLVYAYTLPNRLRLAGLPETDDLLALADDPTPSVELATSNTAYVAEHQDEFAAIIARSSGLAWMFEGYGAG